MTAAVVTPREFLRIVRENPRLFRRGDMTRASGLSRSSVFEMLRARNPRLRGQVDPKLDTLERFVRSCGGRLLVTLPPSVALDLSLPKKGRS